jgi:predicted site-specific integrase-resolvase
MSKPPNTDELIAQMQADETDGAIKLSPREWAKLRGVTPQLVYYWIRTGKLDMETCICGRNVIDVEKADEHNGKRKGILDSQESTEQT